MGNARSRTVKVKPLSGARKAPRPEQSVMETSDLTTHEIWFLKALRSAGAHGRIVSALVARLVQIAAVFLLEDACRDRSLLFFAI
jgi:hypothetical protein